jgi:hypothetical protein
VSDEEFEQKVAITEIADVTTLICDDRPQRGSDAALWKSRHPVGILVTFIDGTTWCQDWTGDEPLATRPWEQV